MGTFDLSKRHWQWAALLFMAFIWGSSFILIKKSLYSYTNIQVGALRIFISFVLFSPIWIRHIRSIKKSEIVPLLIIGYAGNFFPAFLFSTAQTEISSALSGMLNTLTPFFTLFIGYLFYKLTASLLNIIGILIGMVGAISLVLLDSGKIADGSNNWFAIFAVIATIGYGLSTNQTKSLHDLGGLKLAAFAFLFTGPVAFVVLFTTDFTAAMQTPNYIQNFGYIFILALFSSVLAIVLFNELIKHTTAIFAASVTYIIPVFAITWGIFDGETITVMHIGSISVIMLGVYLVNAGNSFRFWKKTNK